MENGTLAVGPAVIGGRSFGLRASSVVAAVALVLTMFVLVQDRADAAPAVAGAAVAASVVSVGSGVSAQIDFRSLFCGILISVRNAFAGFFGGLVTSIINSLIVGFGCSPS